MWGFSALCTNEKSTELENNNGIENSKYNVTDGSRPTPFHHQEEKATCEHLSTTILKAHRNKRNRNNYREREGNTNGKDKQEES
jgi:hypothetical protein